MLPVDQLPRGATLALGVPDPAQAGTELLPAGTVVEDARALAGLREVGISTVFIEHPDLMHLDRYLRPVKSRARQVIADLVARTLAAVEGSAPPTVAYPDYYAAAWEMILTLIQKGPPLVYLDETVARQPCDEAGHATAVAHLAVMLGLRLEHYLVRQRARLQPEHAREVVNLCVAAMLHDVGKAKLPSTLRYCNDLRQPADLEQRFRWQAHTRLGYEIVHSGIEASAAAAILHHHQRFDGSGFPTVQPPRSSDDDRPAPPAGPRIHVYARILAAANLFDRLTVDSDGSRPPNLRILHLMRTLHASKLDPEILRVLPHVVPPFPPGSRVELTDGSPAMVVGLCAEDPYRPVVRRVLQDGWTLNGPAIPTAQSGDVLSIRSIEGLPVEGLVPKSPPPKEEHSRAEAVAAA